jgi:flavin reductase (DIM6/NTAB) family NADH-FMN oxidoreductase RutF
MSLRARPWNRVPQAVYSLSTTAEGCLNMNICTYVSPMTMEPKQFMLGIYHDTKTFDNLKQTGEGLLQILGTHQTRYINPLGKKSGFSFNKDVYLRKRSEFDPQAPHLAYLKDCLAYIHLVVKTWTPESDHDLVFCQVRSWRNLSLGTPLTTMYLKEKKIIR